MARSQKWQSYTSGRWRDHVFPVAVWLAAVVGVVALIEHRGSDVELVGLARGEQREIASECDGRLALVATRPFESVRRGQALAVLEDDRIRAELATAGAEAARLRAELQAAEVRLAADAQLEQRDYAAETRRFAVDVEQTRLEMLDLTVTIETDRIELQRLAIELDRMRRLRPQQAATTYEYDLAETQHAEAAREIEENEKTLAQLGFDLQAAIKRRDSFLHRQPSSARLEQALAPLQAAIDVQDARIAELSLQRSTLVLCSPIDGVVGEVLRGAGEVVLTGDPIVTVIASRPSEVLAYVNAAEASRIRPGVEFELQLLRAPASREKYATEAIAVGPAVVQLPQRLWRNPTVPEWGCPVRMTMPANVRLLCDEVVAVHLRGVIETSTNKTNVKEETGGAL